MYHKPKIAQHICKKQLQFLTTLHIILTCQAPIRLWHMLHYKTVVQKILCRWEFNQLSLPGPAGLHGDASTDIRGYNRWLVSEDICAFSASEFVDTELDIHSFDGSVRDLDPVLRLEVLARLELASWCCNNSEALMGLHFMRVRSLKMQVRGNSPY